MANLLKTAFAIGCLVTGFSTTASAAVYRHIDELACNIERNSNRLVSEVRQFRFSPDYRHLVQDARDMARLADHIHDLAHHHGRLEHLEADLADLDRKFHHLQGLIRHIERGAGCRYGQFHSRPSRVGRLLHAIEDDIHHLQDDIRSLRVPACDRSPIATARPTLHSRSSAIATGYGRHPAAYSRAGQFAPPPFTRRDAFSTGNSISFGGGSTRFTIRF